MRLLVSVEKQRSYAVAKSFRSNTYKGTRGGRIYYGYQLPQGDRLAGRSLTGGRSFGLRQTRPPFPPSPHDPSRLEYLDRNFSNTQGQETSASGLHFSYNPPKSELPAPILELRGGMCDLERKVRSARDWLRPRR